MKNKEIEDVVEEKAAEVTAKPCENCTDAVTDCSVCKKGDMVE